jgi:cell division protein FtsN
MDWMRRNWPDLLIGLALLLVIGGIIATLLNGGNFLPFGRGSQPATVGSGATSSQSAETVTPLNPNNEATQNAPATTGVVPVDPNQSQSVSIGEETGTIVPVPPTLDGTDPSGTDTATQAIDAAAGALTDAVAPADAATDVTADTPAANTASDASQVAASSQPTAPYRISVGAFGSAENAERKAQSFRDAGYPVFVGQQGDLSLVLVGPYNSQGEAEQVKAQLQSSGLEANPIVYEFRQEGTDAASADMSTPLAPEVEVTPETETTVTPSEATSTTALATSGSGRYLQVGAYGSEEAAAPQRSLLEGLGFTVSSVEEGSFVKLLVGPYDEANLGAAQSRLSAQGIDNFIR